MDSQEQLQWQLNQNTSIFIQENAFEKGNVVCKLQAILGQM